jgi:hypothetical protein
MNPATFKILSRLCLLLFSSFVFGGAARDDVTPLANTMVHVIAKGNNTFSATVDGQGRGGNYLLGEWMLLADWNPAVYDVVANAALASRRYATNANLTASILYMKQRRATTVSLETPDRRDGDRPRQGDRPRDGDRLLDGGKRDRAVSPETGGFRPERAAGKSQETPAKRTPTSVKHTFNPLKKPTLTSAPVMREEAVAALVKAVRFFHEKVARHGGYLWEYSGDLTLREAEGPVEDGRVWVQPPGTPTIGEAFLDAYGAIGEQVCLDAAMDAARVLIRGQFHTGGWDYSVTTEPGDKRPVRTTLDDDTTQAATRLLMRLDKVLQFQNPEIHDAAMKALNSLLLVQYPNGGWFVFIRKLESYKPEEYPVVKASYPQSWPRSPKGYAERPRICYILNDNLVPNVIRTVLDAWEIYHDERALAAAKKGGDFLLLARMPDPQPAWAQTYDVKMQPVWGRAFEPPAIAGAESQTVLECLLLLYQRTGDRKYLDPVPHSLAYLRGSLLPDGTLARFYELKTNRPLCFTRKYELTYSGDDTPTHYGFVWESRLDEIEAQYKRLVETDPASLSKMGSSPIPNLEQQSQLIIACLDDRGAWLEAGPLRFHRIEPESGVIRCQTFAENVKTLCQFVAGKH